MPGEEGMSVLRHDVLNKMIDVVKEIEPEMGYGPIMQVSQTEAKMREERIKKPKTVCTYCGVGCSYDVWTKGRKILKIVPLQIYPFPQALPSCLHSLLSGTDPWLQTGVEVERNGDAATIKCLAPKCWFKSRHVNEGRMNHGKASRVSEVYAAELTRGSDSLARGGTGRPRRSTASPFTICYKSFTKRA